MNLDQVRQMKRTGQIEYKTLPSDNKVLDAANRLVEGYAAVMGNVDSGWDRLMLGSFRKTLKERGERVRHLWQHDFDQPPTAVIVELEEQDVNALPAKLRKHADVTGALRVVRKYLDTPRGNEVFQGITNGAIQEMSFAFDAVKVSFEEDDEKRTIRNLHEVRLWETSDVLWGMNPLTVASKTLAVKYRDTGTDSETEWREPTLSDFTDKAWSELEHSEKQRIAEHFAWSHTPGIDSFEDLVLPHHVPAKQGVGPVSLDGLGRCLQAFSHRKVMGEYSLDDMHLVYTHLRRHYGQFSKRVPDFEVLSLLWTSDMLVQQEMLTGFLSEPEIRDLLHLMDRIKSGLPRIDSTQEVNRVASGVLLQRLEIAERFVQLHGG